MGKQGHSFDSLVEKVENLDPEAVGALPEGANAVSASKLQTARTISLSGDATGSASFDGSANADIPVTVGNDSHSHSADTLPTASTSAKGLVQLSTSVASTSTTTAATSSAVKAAKDAADSAQSTADAALPASSNAVSATKLKTARTISLSGDASGSASFDGSANVSIPVTVANDSHSHSADTLPSASTSAKGVVQLSASTASTSTTTAATSSAVKAAKDAADAAQEAADGKLSKWTLLKSEACDIAMSVNGKEATPSRTTRIHTGVTVSGRELDEQRFKVVLNVDNTVVGYEPVSGATHYWGAKVEVIPMTFWNGNGATGIMFDVWTWCQGSYQTPPKITSWDLYQAV